MSLNPLLNQLIDTLTYCSDLEGISRSLLKILQSASGLESVYLAKANAGEAGQRIQFAHNVGSLVLVEGLGAPTEEPLHRGVPREAYRGQPLSSDGPGAAPATQPVHIRTYIGEPVWTAGGELYGTLGGVSGTDVEISADARRLMTLFAWLIARQIDRERLQSRPLGDQQSHSRHALIDPLTGIVNRRALLNELNRMLANAERAGCGVQVAFIGLDSFGAINEGYGHDVGDQFLVHIARSLTGGMRQGDLVARYGSDEFVVVAPASGKAGADNRDALRARLEQLLSGHFDWAAAPLEQAGASVAVVTSAAGERDPQQLLNRAAKAMQEVKRFRRADAQRGRAQQGL